MNMTNNNPNSTLHEFDLALCAHATFNVRCHLTLDVIRDRIKNLRPELASYLLDHTSPNPCVATVPELLLCTEDFWEMADVMRSMPIRGMRPWRPLESLYQQATICTGEIRQRLAPAEAQRWAAEALEFSQKLLTKPLAVADGLITTEEWTNRIRHFKEAMCDFQYLPRPQGRFPTPSDPHAQRDVADDVRLDRREIVERVRKALLELPNGPNLRPDELIKLLKMNRQALREALRILEAEEVYQGFRRKKPARYVK